MKTTINSILLEKDNVTGNNLMGPNANFPVSILTASSIIGDRLVNNSGLDVGKIKDIMINIHEGNIQYVVIEFGGFMGFGEKLFAIPYSSLKLNPKDHNFVLDVDKKFLASAPGFDKDHWPSTNSHYNDVDTHWDSLKKRTK
jgi:sporulation protein YlmC with PRC-barrel domain